MCKSKIFTHKNIIFWFSDKKSATIVCGNLWGAESISHDCFKADKINLHLFLKDHTHFFN